VPSGSRPRRSQLERRRATRDALVTAARRLFTEDGFATVSVEQLVAAAGVTRGAFYHHYRDKNEIFREAYVQLEKELSAELTARIDAAASAVDGLLSAIGWFLDVCQRPEVRQIALVDAPAVLGWQTWRQIETEYALGILTERLQAAQTEGAVLPGPVDVVAKLLFGTVLEAALSITHSPEPDAVRAAVEPTLYGIGARMLR
jgi:AcrR family transcriptional regulator